LQDRKLNFKHHENLYYHNPPIGFIYAATGQYNPQLIDSTKTWSTINEYTAGGGIIYSFWNKFMGDSIINGQTRNSELRT